MVKDEKDSGESENVNLVNTHLPVLLDALDAVHITVQGNKGYARLHRRGLILTGSKDRDWGLSPKGKHWFRRLRRCKIGYQASTTASRSENDRDTKDTKVGITKTAS
eukprot:1392688-Amorphochlora_amoeboformis.AAC.1